MTLLNEHLYIKYFFKLNDGREENFTFTFEQETMRAKFENNLTPPEWAKLDFCKCPHCPLKVEVSNYCSPAVNLSNVLSRLGKVPSYEKLILRVVTEEREVIQKTTAQNALGSLMGLIMATSECPFASFFRPMARFHLPLASSLETVFRTVSSYLLGQYFRGNHGLSTDFSLAGLSLLYSGMQAVNSAFSKRLVKSGVVDETNAIVQLDLHAQTLPAVIQDSVRELSPLFQSYLIKDEK